MKKIGIIISIIMLLSQSYATTICAANDTVALVLDPTIPIKGYSSDNTSGTWRVWSDAGTISGISTCLNKGSDDGKTVPYLYDKDNNGETKLVVGTERYGIYCWCKIIHPVSSLWAYNKAVGYGLSCSNCASKCGMFMQSNITLRSGLFGSVEN